MDPFGKARVTKSPAATPAARSAQARRVERRSSSPHDTVSAPCFRASAAAPSRAAFSAGMAPMGTNAISGARRGGAMLRDRGRDAAGVYHHAVHLHVVAVAELVQGEGGLHRRDPALHVLGGVH